MRGAVQEYGALPGQQTYVKLEADKYKVLMGGKLTYHFGGWHVRFCTVAQFWGVLEMPVRHTPKP